MLKRYIYLGLILLLFYGVFCYSASGDYDPLAVSGLDQIKVLEMSIRDRGRNRDIPLRIYLPNGLKPAPVVLFSHGLGGSCKGNAFMGRHWAARGYVAVFIQHPGSDTSVWKRKPRRKRMAALRKAANAENFILRVKDVSVVLDRLEKWQKAKKHSWAGRLNLNRVGMSGHSFGAITTQAVSGQVFGKNKLYTDFRIKAAIAFSPSSPKFGSPQQAFAKVEIPWMLMTGTKDTAPIGHADVKSRLAVFPALPPGGKYELVLYKAEHSAFTERSLPRDTEKRNPNHHRVILALSTAFWDTRLRNDSKAKEWLNGNGPDSVLEKEDRWQRK